MIFGYLSHCQAKKAQVQTHQNLLSLPSKIMNVHKDSNRNLDLKLCWIHQHGYLFETFVHMILNAGP